LRTWPSRARTGQVGPPNQLIKKVVFRRPDRIEGEIATRKTASPSSHQPQVAGQEQVLGSGTSVGDPKRPVTEFLKATGVPFSRQDDQGAWFSQLLMLICGGDPAGDLLLFLLPALP